MNDLVNKKNIQTERSVFHSFGFWLGACAGLIATDQVAKYFAGKSNWRIFQNNNFAFSIPLPTALMFAIYIVALAIVVRIIFKQWKVLTRLSKFGWALVLAGGVSNIVERIILGYVRDFIFIANGIFNLADFFIILGLLIVVFTYLKKL